MAHVWSVCVCGERGGKRSWREFFSKRWFFTKESSDNECEAESGRAMGQPVNHGRGFPHVCPLWAECIHMATVAVTPGRLSQVEHFVLVLAACISACISCRLLLGLSVTCGFWSWALFFFFFWIRVLELRFIQFVLSFWGCSSILERWPGSLACDCSG